MIHDPVIRIYEVALFSTAAGAVHRRELHDRTGYIRQRAIFAFWQKERRLTNKYEIRFPLCVDNWGKIKSIGLYNIDGPDKLACIFPTLGDIFYCRGDRVVFKPDDINLPLEEVRGD